MNLNLCHTDFVYNEKYLAGLIDSDGNIYLDYRKNNNKMYPILKLSIAQEFPFLLFSIKSVLGVGSVSERRDSNCWVYEVTGRQSIELLKKIKDFLIIKKSQAEHCLDILKDYKSIKIDEKIIKDNKSKNTELRHKISKDLRITNEWFGGFFDGDGFIGASLQKGSKKPRIRMTITIDKKDIIVAENLKNKYGGKVFKSGNNIRWDLGINSKNLVFLETLIFNVNLKREQVFSCYEWLNLYPTNKREIVSLEESEKFVTKLQKLKDIDNVPFYGNLLIDDYQKWTKTTAIYNKDIALTYTCLGLCGEVGEVSNLVKKIYRDDNGELTEEKRSKILDELSDVIWYLARLCDEFNVKMSSVMKSNLIKLEDRKKRNVIKGSGDNR